MMDASLLPEVQACRPDGSGVLLTLYLAPDLPWFSGHFPGAALLPGVTQLHWALALARREGVMEGQFSGMDQLKFQRPLLPGMRCALSLQRHAEGRLRFEYRILQPDGEPGELASSGRVSLT